MELLTVVLLLASGSADFTADDRRVGTCVETNSGVMLCVGAEQRFPVRSNLHEELPSKGWCEVARDTEKCSI